MELIDCMGLQDCHVPWEYISEVGECKYRLPHSHTI